MRSSLVAGTRTSKLALWQTHHVIDLLAAAWPGLDITIRDFTTEGDRILDKPLAQIGGKGLFTQELEAALLAGRIDFAVHSLKDLPVEETPGLALGAVACREEVRDALVARDGLTLATLPPGAVVGTSSLRRQAQLLALRPDLEVRSIRGNVDTRVRKVLEGHYDAALLAGAGLARLGLDGYVSEWLDLETMLPAPGQGALAVQCRAADGDTLTLLAALDDADLRAAVGAERAFLHGLGAGCSAPVAAHASVVRSPAGEARIELTALLASADGATVIRLHAAGSDGPRLGRQAARQMLAQGGATLLGLAEPAPEAASTGPLFGRRIVVTRAAEQAGDLSAALAAAGAQPIEIPAIRIEPLIDKPSLAALDAAIAALDSYAWLIFTSANAVQVFCDRAGTALCLPPSLRVAAVGTATAAALRGRGLRADFVPPKFVGEEVAAGLGDVRGARILLPRAETAREALPELLATAGATVDVLPIYRTLPADFAPDALGLLRGGVDVLTFTSGSTVRSFAAALERAGLGGLLAATPVACIGPVTAQTARDLGLTPAVVAETHTGEGLVRALADYFERSTFNV
jgi:hydroxymethylbilane synthase